MTLLKTIFHREKPGQGIGEDEIVSFLKKHWGSPEIVSKGKKVDASKLPRIVVRNEKGKLLGLATYTVDKESLSCELVTIDAVFKRKGIGSGLLNAIEEVAREEGYHHVWLITTNDNPEAAAFYVKRGYRLIRINLDALEHSRKLKPQIPLIGNYGIPLRDEWVFEKKFS